MLSIQRAELTSWPSCVAGSTPELQGPRAQERLQPTAAQQAVSPVRLKEVAVSELRALHRGSRQETRRKCLVLAAAKKATWLVIAGWRARRTRANALALSVADRGISPEIAARSQA